MHALKFCTTTFLWICEVDCRGCACVQQRQKQQVVEPAADTPELARWQRKRLETAYQAGKRNISVRPYFIVLASGRSFGVRNAAQSRLRHAARSTHDLFAL